MAKNRTSKLGELSPKAKELETDLENIATFGQPTDSEDVSSIGVQPTEKTLTQKNTETENIRATFLKANASEKVQITLFLPESYVDLLKRLQTEFGYKNLSSTMDGLLRQLIDERQLPDLRNQYKEPKHVIVHASEDSTLSLYVKEHVLSEKMVNQSYTVSSKYRDELKSFVEEMEYKSMSELMCELFRKMIN